MGKILEVINLSKEYEIKGGGFLKNANRRKLSAVHNVDFVLHPNEILSLVGESGCGKSTVAKAVMQLLDSYEGEIYYKGQLLKEKDKNWIRDHFRPHVQMIFQDPYSCLNPQKKVGSTLTEVLKVHKIGETNEREALAVDILKKCGLDETLMQKYPRELSGGQCQRVGIARALLTKPDILIADEPISALDVSVQAQIINLLLDLKEEMNLSILFISHNLDIVKYISDRVAVMYLGEIVEMGGKTEVFSHPKHPYTKLLLSSVPELNLDDEIHEKEITVAELPSAINLPEGCRFQTRCPYAIDKCKVHVPKLEKKRGDHEVACYRT